MSRAPRSTKLQDARPRRSAGGRRMEVSPAAAALVAALVVATPLALWASTWGGAESSAATFAREAVRGSIPAACWMAMAFGFGWPLRVVLIDANAAVSPPSRSALQLALGVAAALALDALLGTLGAFRGDGAAGLGRGGAIGWGLVAIGAAMAIGSLVRRHRPDGPPSVDAAPWLVIAAAPALAALAVAASSAPGYLWSSEFGGYDALSYHLQLPREWLAGGRLVPTPHNVYGFLPSFVESAFLHLMAMHGGGADGRLAAHDAAIACQWLHALMTIGAAWLVGACAAAWTRPGGHPAVAGSIAGVLVLATPWTIVVGSLAYSEMPTCMFLAAGLILLGPEAGEGRGITTRSVDMRRAAALGVLVGAACGAKLTAVGFVAAPLAACALLALPVRRWPVAVVVAGASAAIVLAPWLVRNAVACGNPLFPFATGLFGAGGWTAEQVETFARGHRADAGPIARLIRFVRQVPLFGVGPNPAPGEPWRPQWSLTPWLGAAGIVRLALVPSRRPMALRLGVVFGVQVAFWLAFTHLQSRFLVPAVAPLAIAVGIAAATRPSHDRRAAVGPCVVDGPFDEMPRRRIAFAGTVLAALAAVPLWLFALEGGGAPAAAIGQSSLFAGDAEASLLRGDDPLVAAEVRRAPSAALVLNHLLGPHARVLLVGEARPFWLRGDDPPRGDAAAIVWQTTWDRGPLSRAMRRQPDDPAGWTRALRDEGITHVLIDAAMLDRWARSGWNDPLLTSQRALRLAEAPNRIAYRLPGGQIVVALASE